MSHSPYATFHNPRKTVDRNIKITCVLAAENRFLMKLPLLVAKSQSWVVVAVYFTWYFSECAYPFILCRHLRIYANSHPHNDFHEPCRA